VEGPYHDEVEPLLLKVMTYDFAELSIDLTEREIMILVILARQGLKEGFFSIGPL
jgi:hypothetical protein